MVFVLSLLFARFSFKTSQPRTVILGATKASKPARAQISKFTPLIQSLTVSCVAPPCHSERSERI